MKWAIGRKGVDLYTQIVFQKVHDDFPPTPFNLTASQRIEGPMFLIFWLIMHYESS